jgi:polyisoprenoid-binding protein YceI
VNPVIRKLRLAALLLASAAASADAAPSRYTQSAGSMLQFEFSQLGAPATGEFRQFTTELVYDQANLAASSLKVTIQVASLDTQDGERDGVLKDVDLFDVKKHATATFVSGSLARSTDGGNLVAIGKLTIRGITRDIKLPVSINPTAGGLELSGQTTLNRLDFGVGQGEWKSTESVGNAVKVRYKVNLVKAG